MRKLHYLVMTVLVFVSLACSSQRKTEEDSEVMMAHPDSTVVAGLQRMQVSEAHETFTFKDKEYQSTVVRRPDENLPTVKDEQGVVYVDNRISLKLTCGGKPVVDKVFTKDDFAALVDAAFLKHAVLEGLVFDEVTAGHIVYAASIGYPQSDLYVPLTIKVSAEGGISMEQRELMEEVREVEDNP